MIRRLVLAAVAVLGLTTAHADGPEGTPISQAQGGKTVGGGDGFGGAYDDGAGRLTTLNSGQGNLINVRIKDMMIRRAIDAGFHRIEFRVDERNKRSQAAMTKLGAHREGIRRADTVTWTGHVRDTVMFSILKDEWPPAPEEQESV